MSTPRILKSLPPDVWFNILISVTDLTTLHQAIQASEEARQVFEQYTKTVMTAVARTEVGPALPSALLLALVLRKVHSEGIESDLDIWKSAAINAFLHITTEDTASFPSSADWDLAREVSYSASCMELCEEFYSRKFYDVTSCRSMLSLDMSERFRRAFYRFFLYRLITFGEFYIPRRSAEIERIGRQRARWESNVANQRRYQEPRRPNKLRFFSCTLKTDEEKEDFAAAVYLLEQHFAPWFSNAISSAAPTESEPEYIIDLYGLGSNLKLSRWPNGKSKKWKPETSGRIGTQEMTSDVCELLEIRWESLTWRHFIDKRLPLHPKCRCTPCGEGHTYSTAVYNERYSVRSDGHPDKNGIYNKTNWGMLYGDMSLQYLLETVFPHRLFDNDRERSPIIEWSHSLCIPEVIGSIFKSARVRGEELKEEDWMCSTCFMTFLKRHGPVWWAERRRQDGYNIPSDDCKEGFTCLEQNDSAHIEKYNHFCRPTQDSEYVRQQKVIREVCGVERPAEGCATDDWNNPCV